MLIPPKGTLEVPGKGRLTFPSHQHQMGPKELIRICPSPPNPVSFAPSSRRFSQIVSSLPLSFPCRPLAVPCRCSQAWNTCCLKMSLQRVPPVARAGLHTVQARGSWWGLWIGRRIWGTLDLWLRGEVRGDSDGKQQPGPSQHRGGASLGTARELNSLPQAQGCAGSRAKGMEVQYLGTMAEGSVCTK